MQVAAAPVAVAAVTVVPVPSIFTFQGDVKLWVPAMGLDPLIFTAPDTNLTQYLCA
jgi:hypothetical protein